MKKHKDKHKRTTFYLSEDSLKKLKILAFALDKSSSSQVVEFLINKSVEKEIPKSTFNFIEKIHNSKEIDNEPEEIIEHKGHKYKLIK